VLVSLDGGPGDRVNQRAWELDRDLNAVLDEFGRYALIHYEDALDLHDH
jgi:hypothetical protein